MIVTIGKAAMAEVLLFHHALGLTPGITAFADELRAAGVGPGTIRLSVGTESIDDLIWDLEQGFARVAAST